MSFLRSWLNNDKWTLPVMGLPRHFGSIILNVMAFPHTIEFFDSNHNRKNELRQRIRFRDINGVRRILANTTLMPDITKKYETKINLLINQENQLFFSSKWPVLMGSLLTLNMYGSGVYETLPLIGTATCVGLSLLPYWRERRINEYTKIQTLLCKYNHDPAGTKESLRK